MKIVLFSFEQRQFNCMTLIDPIMLLNRILNPTRPHYVRAYIYMMHARIKFKLHSRINAIYYYYTCTDTDCGDQLPGATSVA